MRSSTARTLKELHNQELSEVITIDYQLQRFKTLGWGIKELTKFAAVYNKAIHIENSHTELHSMCVHFLEIFEKHYGHLLIDIRECNHSIKNSIIKRHDKLEIPKEISTLAKRTVLLARYPGFDVFPSDHRLHIENSALIAASYGDPDAMLEWAHINFNSAQGLDSYGNPIRFPCDKTLCFKTAIYWSHRSYTLGTTNAASYLFDLVKSENKDVTNYAKLACIDLKLLPAPETKSEKQEVGVVFHEDESVGPADPKAIFVKDNFRANLDEMIKSKLNLASLNQPKSDEPECEVTFHENDERIDFRALSLI